MVVMAIKKKKTEGRDDAENGEEMRKMMMVLVD